MKTITFFMMLCVGMVSAQKTLSLPDGENSPKANLDQVAWIEGHWKGEAFGGIAEEIWSPPLGNSMMFVFRLVNNGKVSFYESGHIQEVDETIILQLKHFDGSMKGWEEKDKTIDFKLVKIEPNKVYFDGMTMEKVNEDQINVWVLIEENGNQKEILFSYKRV